jgi:hypothetical protein
MRAVANPVTKPDTRKIKDARMNNHWIHVVNVGAAGTRGELQFDVKAIMIK